MSKFSEILNGWKNLLLGNPEVRKMANDRMAVCEKCSHASEKIYLHCSLCGCYIPAKARSESSHCPIELW